MARSPQQWHGRLYKGLLPQAAGLDEDAVVVAGDSSDDETAMVGDTVMVGTSARVYPTDVGFTDFSDFGGFQPFDEPAGGGSPDRDASPGAGGDRQGSFSDPTDRGKSPSGSTTSAIAALFSNHWPWRL